MPQLSPILRIKMKIEFNKSRMSKVSKVNKLHEVSLILRDI